jgi:uncharacterized protein
MKRWPPLALAAVCTACPALAEVRLTPDAGGANYAVKVMSWAEIPFRSVVRQQYDFSCGSAAIATLLTYHYGIRTDETQPFKVMWTHGDRDKIRKVGFSMLDMKLYLQARGLRAEGYRFSVAELDKIRRPSIALVELRGFKHFVVVKGVRGDRVLVGDPVLGLGEYSRSDFAKMWNGIVLAIVSTEGAPKPAFNLASDWGPWSKAPLENNMLTTSIGDLTSNLRPDYQITPEILLDVRVGTVP